LSEKPVFWPEHAKVTKKEEFKGMRSPFRTFKRHRQAVAKCRRETSIAGVVQQVPA
jgi:hypothetical protein